ncbi:MAG: DUF4215 domain-containing protein [Myxococcales bacterium]|nr:DUF4215 domain-containing protein [Myxococcales bacterium]
MNRLFCLGLCSAALVACGNDNNEPTADGSASEGQTTTQPDTDDDDADGTNSQSNSEPTTDDGGTMSAGNTMATTDATDPTGGTTMIVTTDTDTDGDTSTTAPPMPVCGDGDVEGTEECDDGNQEPGDGCEDNCTVTAVCGDGAVQAGEVCDDGNTMDGDECSADCQVATPPQVCGDGTVQDPEVCDDGNDIDGDGCESDCTETPALCGNMVIDPGEQCDDGNDVDGGPNDFCLNNCTTYNPPSCQAPPMYNICDGNLNLGDKNDKTSAHKAIGICNEQINNSVLISNFQFDAPANASWQVAKGFGSYTYDHDMDPATPDKLLYSPREGDAFLIVSTGVIAAPNNQGIVTELPNTQLFNNANQNPDVPDSLPAPLSQQLGSNNGAGGTPFMGCDGDNDCSDTLLAQWNLAQQDPNDKLFFRFNTTVPAGTYGYRFDFVFCSAEWPTYVNTKYNDLLIAWQTDPSPDDPNQDPPVDPYTGNVTFIPNPNDPTKGLPLTITALDPYFDGPGYTFNEPQLTGTGFEQHACTDWFTAKGGVQPGADLDLGFFLSDMGDTNLATLAIIDNFRWDCEGCVPSEVDDCGVQDPQ